MRRILSRRCYVSSSRRSILYVPGSSEKMLNSSFKSNADTVVYDLEDSVAHDQKSIARHMKSSTFHTSSEKAVRINAIGSSLEVEDLNVILRSENLNVIVIPKVESSHQVKFVSNLINKVASNINVKILVSIESAIGLLNVQEIAESDCKVEGLIFAAEDYCADLGLVRTPSRREMLYARQHLVNVAVANKMQCLDMVCVDFTNDKILIEECNEGRQWGFSGKQAIHPRQVDIIQQAYMPDAKEIDKARRILLGYNENLKIGVGAFSMDGEMIDMPVVKWAIKLLERIGERHEL